MPDIRGSGGVLFTDAVAFAKGIQSGADGAGVATGKYAHAEGTGTASGQAAHAEGGVTSASATNSHAEGQSTAASGSAAHAEGFSTTASGSYSHAEGLAGTASGYASHAQGAYSAAPRYAQHSHAGQQFSTAGDAQTVALHASVMTLNATPTVITIDQQAVTLTGATTNVLTIPTNRAHQFRVAVVARRTDVTGDFAGWRFEGVIARASGSAAFVGTVDGRSWSSGSGSAAWDVTLSVDTTDGTNNYLKITVTGEAAKTIRWSARIDTVEVG